MAGRADPPSLIEVTKQAWQGTAKVAYMWHWRLGRLAETYPGRSAELCKVVRYRHLLLSAAIRHLLTFTPDEYAPAKVFRHRDEEHGSPRPPALPPGDEPDEAPEPLEPVWNFAVLASVRDLAEWARILEDLKGFTESPPPEFLERIDETLRRHLHPERADLLVLDGEPDESADA